MTENMFDTIRNTVYEGLAEQLDLHNEIYLDVGRFIKIVLAIGLFVLTCHWSEIHLTIWSFLTGILLLGLFLEDPLRVRLTKDSKERLFDFLHSSK